MDRPPIETVLLVYEVTPKEARKAINEAFDKGQEVEAYWNHPSHDLDPDYKFGAVELDSHLGDMTWWHDNHNWIPED